MATKRELRTVLSLKGEQEYSRAMKGIGNTLGLVATQQRLLSSQYDASDRSLSKLTQQHDILSRKLEAQKSKLALINKAYQESAQKGDAAAEATQALAKDLNLAQAAVNKTERELDELNDEMEAATSKAKKFSKQMKELGVNANSVGSAMQKAGDKVAKVAMGFAVGVTTAAVKGWMELEDQMANVATIADTTDKSMEDLTNEVIAVSDATGIAATEIAQAQYQAISAGIATADSAGLVEMAAMAAKAGVSDVTTVIEGSTSIINAWGLSIAESESVFDKLLKTQQRGKTTIGELANGIGQVTGLAPQLGISLDEILASVATLTLSGVDTNTAMTGLKGVMSAIIKPTAEAREEAERLGLQFDAAAVEALGFTGFLEEVMEKTGGDAESLAKLFGSVDALSQIMLLGGASAETYADILNDLGNSAGTLDTMFDERTSSSAERFKTALNKINNAAISLGQSLAPMIEVAAGSIENFAESLKGMSAEQMQGIISTSLWIAGVAKSISVMGGLIKNIGEIKKGFSAVSTLLGSAGPVIGGITLATAAVAGLGAAFHKVSVENTLELDGIDASELPKQKIDGIEDFTYGEEITVTVNAKLKVEADVKELSEGIKTTLNDGKSETQQEIQAIYDDYNEIINVGYASIEDNYNRRKETLNKQFEAGLITPKTHAKNLRELDSQTKEMTDMLDTNSSEFSTFVSTIIKENRKMTEDELASLDQILYKLGETTNYIIDANDAARQTYEWAYRKTVAGVGTETDRALAIEYIELQYVMDEEALEEQRKEINERYASLITPEMDAVDIKRVANLEAAELEAVDREFEKIASRRDEMYGDILQTELEKIGWTPEEIERLYRYSAEGLTERGAMTNLLTAGLQDTYNDVLTLTEKMNAADFAVIENILGSWALNGSGNADAISNQTGELETLFNLISDNEDLENLPNEYEDIGSNVVDGLIRGMVLKFPALEETGHSAGRIITNATRQTLKINSPSRIFTEIGNFTMEGLIGGVNERLDDVQKTYARAVMPRMETVTAAANTTATAGKASIINNINYTAGAGSRREARLLSQRLAQEQKSARMAEGL